MATQQAPYDSTRWTSSNARLHNASTREEIRIHYISCLPPSNSAGTASREGTILLIHGFPQTSYQFRHVITPLADAGYRVIAPDYRGAGDSSRPRNGYTKTILAQDLHELLTLHLHLDKNEKVHVVGHDIGGMIAYAYASRYPDATTSVAWGECPLPGTRQFEAKRHAPGNFHFTLHNVHDLPEALTQGRERLYLQNFYERLTANPRAIADADVDHYAGQYAKAGAMRAAFDVYRAFGEDAEENQRWVAERGKCPVPALSLSGSESFDTPGADVMLREVHESVEVGEVEGSGHYIAEERPEGFVRAVLSWVKKHES